MVTNGILYFHYGYIQGASSFIYNIQTPRVNDMVKSMLIITARISCFRSGNLKGTKHSVWWEISNSSGCRGYSQRFGD